MNILQNLFRNAERLIFLSFSILLIPLQDQKSKSNQQNVGSILNSRDFSSTNMLNICNIQMLDNFREEALIETEKNGLALANLNNSSRNTQSFVDYFVNIFESANFSVRVEPHDQKLFGEFGEKTLNELINYVLNKPVIETLGEIGQYILNNYEDFTLVIIAFVFITVFKAFDRRYPFNKNEKGGIISYFFRFLGFPSNFPDSPEHNKKSPRPGIFELFFIA